MVSSNGDGVNGASEQESSANVGAERGVDEGQDVYISGGNSDNGKLSLKTISLSVWLCVCQ